MQELRVVPPPQPPVVARSHERLERHAVLEAAFDGSPDAIVAVDAELRAIRLNAAAERLFGVDVSEWRGASCHDVLGCDEPISEWGDGSAARSPACERCPFREAIALGGSIDRRVVINGGEDRHILAVGSFAPIHSAAGGALGVLRPIADRRKPRPADVPGEAFAQTLAQQARSTLALISGYSQTLRHLEIDDETRQRFLDRMTAAADWLAEVADEVFSEHWDERAADIAWRGHRDIRAHAPGSGTSHVAEAAQGKKSNQGPSRDPVRFPVTPRDGGSSLAGRK